MLLAIDLGNTNTKFAVYDGDRQVGSWSCATDAKRTADEYAAWLGQLMTLQSFDRRSVTRSIVSSVVPEADFAIAGLCRKYFGGAVLTIGDPAVKLGMGALIERPEELGADRVVSAVGGFERYGGPLIIVDFGTATTFDSIDDQGNYAGGIIAPGINLSLEALYMAAAKLPRVAVRRPAKLIGVTTISQMQSGIFWGYVGLIEGILTRMKQELGGPRRVVATGGLAAMFNEATAAFDHVDGELALRGLVLIDRLNRA